MDFATALLLGGASAFGAAKANSQASRSVDRAHDFSERMSNTAYQRAMSDMRAAGLNPILAAKLGGASTPTGQTYTPQNIGAAFGQGFSQGSSAMQSQAQTKKVQAETQNIEKMGRKIEAEIKHLGAQVGLTEQQATKVGQETSKIVQEVSMLKSDKEMFQRFGKWMAPMMKKLGIPGGATDWLGPKSIGAVFDGVGLALQAGKLGAEEVRKWILGIFGIRTGNKFAQAAQDRSEFMREIRSRP